MERPRARILGERPFFSLRARIGAVVLCGTCVSGASCLAQVVAQHEPGYANDQSLSANSAEEGQACYEGTCDGCDDCSTRLTISSCYLCCGSNGCFGASGLHCQGHCDGTASPQQLDRFRADGAAFVAWATELYEGGARLTHEAFDLLDAMIAQPGHGGDVAAKLALAVANDMYLEGRGPGDALMDLKIAELERAAIRFGGARSATACAFVRNAGPVSPAQDPGSLLDLIAPMARAGTAREPAGVAARGAIEALAGDDAAVASYLALLRAGFADPLGRAPALDAIVRLAPEIDDRRSALRFLSAGLDRAAPSGAEDAALLGSLVWEIVDAGDHPLRAVALEAIVSHGPLGEGSGSAVRRIIDSAPRGEVDGLARRAIRAVADE